VPVRRPGGRASRPRLVAGQRGRRALEPQGLRLTHRMTDRLSQKGQDLLLAGFVARKPYVVIARELELIGERISGRAVARTGLRWRAEKVRHAVLAELDGALLRAGLWRIEEVVGLIDAMDLDAGWRLRCRHRLWKLLRAFVKTPNLEALRAVEKTCLIFWLTATVVSRGHNEHC